MNIRETTGNDFQAVLGWMQQHAAAGSKLRSDSRLVEAGDIFFALPGSRSSPQDYVSDALQRGAQAVVIAPVAVAGDLAAAYLDFPSRKLPVVAVTGTNGKTSITHWIAQAYAKPTAVIGTLGAGFIGERRALETFGLTTPDAVRLQQMLHDFRQEGASLVAMEASSIGLHQGRLQGLEPAVAVFTNLSRDHLDYHDDMHAYAQAKAGLFAMLGHRQGLHATQLERATREKPAHAVINADDTWAQTMIDACPRASRLWFYSVEDRPDQAIDLAARHNADLLWASYEPQDRGSGLRWARFAPEQRKATAQGVVQLGLMGRFNAANALAVACTLMALGQSTAQAMCSLHDLSPIPGRMQCIGAPQTPLVVVDYAHTPDAVEQVLRALRPVADQRRGRLHCVLGAGGDRDPGKRHDMAALAIKSCDRLCLTSDNPRYEDPAAICEALRQGAIWVCPEAAYDPARLLVDVDRGSAIEQIIVSADAGDVVLIAGKGHENYQEVRGQRLYFDDCEHARQALARHWSLEVHA